jgi:hypothetical protein
MTKEEVQARVYDVSLVIDECRKRPHTYNTLLEEEKENGTYQFILRRKLSKVLKRGDLCKMAIPGTRFGMAIFYHEQKNYFILVEGKNIGSDVYYFTDYEKISRFYIKLGRHWKLEDNKWVEQEGDRVLFEGNIKKWI